MMRNKWDYVAALAILLNVLDIVITLPYWHLEANPLLIAIGPGGMVATKISAAIGLAFVWWQIEGANRHSISKLCVSGLTAIYAFVVVSNVGVILS